MPILKDFTGYQQTDIVISILLKQTYIVL